MKRMTTITVIAILIAVTQAQAGWLSNIGQRIVNGAINTVQSNISSKVNRTIDNAMDGKLAPQQKNNTQSQVDNYSGQPGLPNPGVSAGGPAIVETQGSTYRGARGKAIPFTGRYEQIDFGGLVFSGEDIFYRDLLMGQKNTLVDEFLEPGFYLIHVKGTSYDVGIMFAGVREDEGVKLGYGINIRKMIANDRNLFLTGNSNGIIYVVEVLPNTLGHLEVVLVNHQSLKGSGNLSIYKIPGPTLK